MKTLRYFTLVMLMCIAHTLFGCEPFVAVPDATFGNGALVTSYLEEFGATDIELTSGTSYMISLTPLVSAGEQSVVGCIYDVVTEKLIAACSNRTNGNFFVLSTSGSTVLSATTFQVADLPTQLCGAALLPDSTTVAVGGVVNDGSIFNAVSVFFDQEAQLLSTNTLAFDGSSACEMHAVAVISTDTIVLAGGEGSTLNFAVAFYNYNNELTRTVTTAFDDSAVAYAVARINDSVIAAGGVSVGDVRSLAIVKYGLDGSFMKSKVYNTEPYFDDGYITTIVPHSDTDFFVGGVYTGSDERKHPFFGIIPNDLEEFIYLKTLPELNLRQVNH